MVELDKTRPALGHAAGEQTIVGATPEPGIERLIALFTAGDHDDEGWQVFIVRAQTVSQPGAHAGPARLLKTRLDERNGRVVINCFGIDGFDDANVIDDLANVWQQF